jgi:AraC-like DNA-binding protein
LFIVLLLQTVYSLGQRKQADSINLYFKQIESLIASKDSYKEAFLDVDYLLDNLKDKQGIEKVNYWHLLTTAYIYKSAVTARSYNESARKLSKKIGFDNGEYRSIFNEAYLLFVNGEFDQSIQLAQKMAQKINVERFPRIYADTHTLISYIHTEKGEFDIALEEGLDLLDIAEKTENEYHYMRAYSALSHYYLRIDDYPKALNYCLKGLHYIIRLKKIQYIYPKIDEIARLSAKQGDIATALRAYAFYEYLEKNIGPAGSYIQSVVYMNMADIFMTNGKLAKAQHYLSQALEINYGKNYLFRIPRALVLQAKLNLKQNDTNQAILNYEKSIKAAENINAFDVVKSNSKILSGLFESTGLPSKAYEYDLLHQAIKDSLFNNEKEQKIIILETRRKVKEISQKKRILELENEAQKARYNKILIILCFVLLSAFIVVFSYVKVRGKNKLLFKRTMELAETQMAMRKKINQLEVSKPDSTYKNDQEEALRNHKYLDDDVKKIILRRLENLEAQHFFVEHDCSLRNVAKKLKTNPKYLSQVINQEKKANFTNYINDLRINHLLSRLLEDKDFRNSKLSYIANSIGYNNLNTFNAAFKKKQGILPSYFIKELLQENP